MTTQACILNDYTLRELRHVIIRFYKTHNMLSPNRLLKLNTALHKEQPDILLSLVEQITKISPLTPKG